MRSLSSSRKDGDGELFSIIDGCKKVKRAMKK